MVALGMIDDAQDSAVQPFFAWLHAMDLGRFNISVDHVFTTIEQAIREVARTPPDVWLLRARKALGSRALSELCADGARAEPLRPVVVVCDDDVTEIREVLNRQVSAVVLVNDSPWQITSAIHAAAARKLFLTSQVLDQYRDRVIELITSPPSRHLHVLTRREHDVLACLAEGKSNAEIGRSLYISRATVGSHVLSILRKLEVSNRTEAAALAYQYGLMDGRSVAPAAPRAPVPRSASATESTTATGSGAATGSAAALQ
ncbi:helix-turn-helix transcriptional regulator, partial [Saccharomonospora halophila]|uniref:helix-turn-helix transcriptional regulator n=1 Tax=Saccharomonospora halophila TaxID=129922 RepID=UPI0003748348